MAERKRVEDSGILYDMPSCGGCRTCELACSFHHTQEFIPSVSSLKVLSKEEGPGYRVLLITENRGKSIACDGCKDLTCLCAWSTAKRWTTLGKILLSLRKKKFKTISKGKEVSVCRGTTVCMSMRDILRINLSNGEIKKEPTLSYAREWLGSTGIAIKILYDELRPWVTPYDPANKIVFGTGALVGTPAPGACKMSASTLGPRTGGWASGLADSYVGGELKCAGYDTSSLKAGPANQSTCGSTTTPLRSAMPCTCGEKTPGRRSKRFEQICDDPSLHILSIGPAGENIVRGACIIQDRARAFGRCGTGAVMGSKNLKAIVAKGNKTDQGCRTGSTSWRSSTSVREMYQNGSRRGRIPKIRHAQAAGEENRRSAASIRRTFRKHGFPRRWPGRSSPKNPSTNTRSRGRTSPDVRSAADATSISPKVPTPGW